MRKIKHSRDFQLGKAANIVFPLFSAEGEKLWVPGWDYKNIMGTTGLHEDYIFLTRNHDHAAADAIWLVKRYEPDNFLVEFYKVEPEEKIGIITVKCTSLSDDITNINVTYEYISLGQRGNEFINGFTSQQYEAFIGEWQRLLEAYFE